MTAEIRHDAEQAGPTRGMGFGRGGGMDSLVQRREAAQRRLSSSVRAAELVDSALRRFDEALAEQGAAGHDGSLRLTVRALLSLAYGTVDYDVTLLPGSADIAVRVRHTPFGPEAEVVDLAPAGPETPATIDLTDAPAIGTPGTGTEPGTITEPIPPAGFETAPTGAPGDWTQDPRPEDTSPGALDPASPWWTPETSSR